MIMAMVGECGEGAWGSSWAGVFVLVSGRRGQTMLMEDARTDTLVWLGKRIAGLAVGTSSNLTGYDPRPALWPSNGPSIRAHGLLRDYAPGRGRAPKLDGSVVRGAAGRPPSAASRRGSTVAT